MQAYKLQFIGFRNFGNSSPGLAIFVVKAKPIPNRINACIKINPDGHLCLFIDALGNPDKQIKFIEMIDMDKRMIFYRED
ncbi:hypothetical protein D3C85_1250480 [compost metagenome]